MGNLFGTGNNGLSFFSKEQKQEMIDDQTTFFITSIDVKEGVGDFKTQWVVSLIQCNDHALEGKLGFAQMPERLFPTLPSRDEIFTAVRSEIEESGEPYGPCVLYQGKKAANGRQPFVGIKDYVESPFVRSVQRAANEEIPF